MKTNLSRRSYSLFVLAAFMAFIAPLAPAASAQQGVIAQVKSPFQTIAIWDSPDNNIRQMIFDPKWDGSDAIQSEVDKRNPTLLRLTYAQYMIPALAAVENPKRILVIGLGGACIQRYIRDLLPDTIIESAEIDPQVEVLAKQYFYLKEDDHQIVHVGDGRKILADSKDKYDIIMLDAFSATSIPYMLATQEFLTIVKDHIAPGGVVCANLWYNQADYHDMIKTYDANFPEWKVLRCPDWSNNILLAFPTKQDLTPEKWMAKADAFVKAHPKTNLPLSQIIDKHIEPQTRVPVTAKILLDKDAPK